MKINTYFTLAHFEIKADDAFYTDNRENIPVNIRIKSKSTFKDKILVRWAFLKHTLCKCYIMFWLDPT